MKPESLVIVEVRGGVVVDVDGLPSGYVWDVRDWDNCQECGACPPYCPGCSARLGLEVNP